MYVCACVFNASQWTMISNGQKLVCTKNKNTHTHISQFWHEINFCLQFAFDRSTVCVKHDATICMKHDPLLKSTVFDKASLMSARLPVCILLFSFNFDKDRFGAQTKPKIKSLN